MGKDFSVRGDEGVGGRWITRVQLSQQDLWSPDRESLTTKATTYLGEGRPGWESIEKVGEKSSTFE